MATITRPAGRPGRLAARYERPRRRWPRGGVILAGLLALLLAALAVGAILLASAHASLRPDGRALARVSLPFGGGRIKSISVTTGPNSRPVPVRLQGDEIWPAGTIPAHKRLDIQVTVSRPGWQAWLTGGSERLHLSLLTPSARLRSPYLTVAQTAPLTLRFAGPVAVVQYGSAGHLQRRVLAVPSPTVTIPRPGLAGTMLVSAVPRPWETDRPRAVSWFPAGAAASAVATPAPGATIKPGTPITLTFNKPVSQALASNMPPLTPATPGAWHQTNSHAITFVPAGAGYGLGARVTVALPRDVLVVGGTPTSSADVAAWAVPPGSTLRLQQLLATLHYLPLEFRSAGTVALTEQAQEAAAIQAPAGSFAWRYPNTPAALRQLWAPGTAGELTRGALMAFESDHGLAADGVAGPEVWRAILAAAIAGRASSFGYTFVNVDKESSPQSETTWHDGQTVASGPVNTGVAAAPTVSGTFAVFEHIPVTTMTGTNPDGSHYSDPGIQWVSYFNGGDALHAFTRAQYGFPQSVGCVEMPLAEAAKVYAYTPIGTIVHVG